MCESKVVGRDALDGVVGRGVLEVAGRDVLDEVVGRDALDEVAGGDAIDEDVGRDILDEVVGRDALDEVSGRDVLDGVVGRDVLEMQRKRFDRNPVVRVHTMHLVFKWLELEHGAKPTPNEKFVPWYYVEIIACTCNVTRCRCQVVAMSRLWGALHGALGYRNQHLRPGFF